MNRAFAIFVGAALAVQLRAQTLNVIHRFAHDPDGAYPRAALVLDGNTLYGTTSGGGGPPDNGTVFKVNLDGTGYATLRRFTNSIDGGWPVGLALSDATLYGTTYYGGNPGGGTLFKLDTNGNGYSILKTFPALVNSTNSDGAGPGELLLSAGTIYGTTYEGGRFGNGAIFKVATNGTGYTVLKTFSATVNGTNADGASPDAGLVLDGGTLYGTTRYGGNAGNGTIFKLGTNGANFSVLWTFSAMTDFANSDGANPESSLAIGGSFLYGTAAWGGRGGGTVFKIATNGSGFSVLKTFAGNDGACPVAGLLLNGSTLFGTTDYGGTSNSGVIFKINTNGTDYVVLKTFAGADGASPDAALVRSGGTLYGTSYLGGSETDSGYGTVFGLTIPPRIIGDDGTFGVRTNRFGFNVAGFSNQVVTIEACTNLVGSWVRLQTNVLENGPLYFNDPHWTNGGARFYRAVTP